MANAYLVVRIKGQADCPYWATTTMNLLKLDKKYRATILPAKGPAGIRSMLDGYIGTFRSVSMWRTGVPLRASAFSNVKEQPSATVTKSSAQRALMSSTSSVKAPSLKTRYFETSLRMSMSDPRVVRNGSPLSLTPTTGHGFGLR